MAPAYNEMLAGLRVGEEVELEVVGTDCVACRYRTIKGERTFVASCTVMREQARWLLASGATWIGRAPDRL